MSIVRFEAFCMIIWVIPNQPNCEKLTAMRNFKAFQIGSQCMGEGEQSLNAGSAPLQPGHTSQDLQLLFPLLPEGAAPVLHSGDSNSLFI